LTKVKAASCRFCFGKSGCKPLSTVEKIRRMNKVAWASSLWGGQASLPASQIDRQYACRPHSQLAGAPAARLSTKPSRFYISTDSLWIAKMPKSFEPPQLPPFHPDVEARLVGCEWRQAVQ